MSHAGLTVYEYRGWRYEPLEDRERDNVKIFHDVVGPRGQFVAWEFSPYGRPTREEFEELVDLLTKEKPDAEL
jgi:hypothetical protein